ASAGASLTPSPAIATTWPCACSSSTSACLASGSTSARNFAMPRRFAIACAVALLSPVAITTVTPDSRSAVSGVRRAGLDRIRHREQAQKRSATRDEHYGLAASTHFGRLGFELVDGDAVLGREAGLAGRSEERRGGKE